MLEWFEYVADVVKEPINTFVLGHLPLTLYIALCMQVPGCHGYGDPAIIGPTLLLLLPCFTRDGVSNDIVAKVNLHAPARFIIFAPDFASK